MSRRIGEYNEGTSAYSIQGETLGSCRIIRPEFPRTHNRRSDIRVSEPRTRTARRIFEGSELMCSIAFEDFRGCAYGIFSRTEVIVASVIVSVLAAIAIALGA